MLYSAAEWASSIVVLPAEFSALARQLGQFRLHFICMAKKTFESLTPEGIAYKISTEYPANEQKQLDAYDIAKAFLRSPAMPIALNTPPKRGDAPDFEDTEPAESKQTRRE
jgi:hypothetical protein